MITTKRFIEICNYAGYETRSYSGRGMYGEYCVGFSSDDSPMYIAGCIIAGAYDAEHDELLEIFSRCKSDTLGYSTIYYFPRLAWED